MKLFLFLFLGIIFFQPLSSFGEDYTMKDSGRRDVFTSGAMRETRENKGRYDLISPIALRRLAVVCEKGALKYSERNWEKGMPMSRLMDSALRHINQYLEGYRDEDHLAHAMWNLMAAIHFEELRPDLNDVKGYVAQKDDLDISLNPK